METGLQRLPRMARRHIHDPIRTNRQRSHAFVERAWPPGHRLHSDFEHVELDLAVPGGHAGKRAALQAPSKDLLQLVWLHRPLERVLECVVLLRAPRLHFTNAMQLRVLASQPLRPSVHSEGPLRWHVERVPARLLRGRKNRAN